MEQKERRKSYELRQPHLSYSSSYLSPPGAETPQRLWRTSGHIKSRLYRQKSDEFPNPPILVYVTEKKVTF